MPPVPVRDTTDPGADPLTGSPAGPQAEAAHGAASGVIRRHDLDAVRSFAMSLGVVLHACLSLSFVPWPIADEVRTEGMTALFAFIHGFRMPLFFLLSGYFAVMLWQRRGARGLISHRVRRVLVPMVVACFTILPLMHWSVGEGLTLRYAPESPGSTPASGTSEERETDRDRWAAARAGDLPRLRALDAEGEDLDARDSFQLTALHWAATANQPEACELLMELGADPESTDGTAATPLISGAFWGSAEACEVLLARGADPEARNQDGTRAVDLANWPWGDERRGTTAFIAGLLRFDVDLAGMPERLRATAAVFGAQVEAPGARGADLDLWAAARAGDLDRIAALDAAGDDLDARDEFQLTALHWAATEDQAEACELLLDLGADLEARDGSRSTPLTGAAFWASPEAAATLLAGGADPEARNQDGTSARELSMWPWGEERRGVTQFIAGLVRYDVDLDTMPERTRRTAAVFADAPPGRSDVFDPSSPGSRFLEELAYFDVGHLWFLWYLMGLLVLSLPVFAIAARLRPASNWSLYVSPLALVALVPLTATLQAIMLGRGLTFFGPSTSSDLAYDPLVLGYYGVFFLFGAAVRGLDPDTRSLTRGWPAMLAIGAAVFLAAGGAAESAKGGELETLVPAVMQATFAWTMTLGLIGLSAKLFHRERAWVRYLSDASYWIYLAHLPLVFLLQGAVARWELPAWQKLGFMVTACLAALLLTYALLIRPTPIGWMLNGRRPARRT
ncbi:MAG: acyltransferase family protein [Planctomycetota bacterium]|nr:acyltransferase family protein [Planctomycetota bacterium]